MRITVIVQRINAANSGRDAGGVIARTMLVIALRGGAFSSLHASCNWEAPHPPVIFRWTLSTNTIPRNFYEDTNPRSRPHRGVPPPHWKLYKMSQNPINCQCFWDDIPDNRGGFGPSPPPPRTVPITPAAGGGFC